MQVPQESHLLLPARKVLPSRPQCPPHTGQTALFSKGPHSGMASFWTLVPQWNQLPRWGGHEFGKLPEEGTHMTTLNFSSAITNSGPWTAHLHPWLSLWTSVKWCRQGLSYVPTRCKWDVKKPCWQWEGEGEGQRGLLWFSLLYLFLVASSGVRSRLLISVLASCGWCNKLPQTQWLKTTEIYSLTVLEGRNPKSVSLAWNQVISRATLLRV